MTDDLHNHPRTEHYQRRSPRLALRPGYQPYIYAAPQQPPRARQRRLPPPQGPLVDTLPIHRPGENQAPYHSRSSQPTRTRPTPACPPRPQASTGLLLSRAPSPGTAQIDNAAHGLHSTPDDLDMYSEYSVDYHTIADSNTNNFTTDASHTSPTNEVDHLTNTQTSRLRPTVPVEFSFAHDHPQSQSDTSPNTLDEEITVLSLKGTWHRLPLRSSSPNDHIKEAELSRIEEQTLRLAEAWSKHNKPFCGDENDNTTVTSTIRRWERFCQVKWQTPTAPTAVRAFISAALGKDLAKEVLDRQSFQIETDLSSRHFYYLLWHYSVSYLLSYYRFENDVITLMKSIYDCHQGSSTIGEFLAKITDDLLEIQCCSEYVDISHLYLSILRGLRHPYSDWFYNSCKQVDPRGLSSISQLLSVFREMKDRSRLIDHPQAEEVLPVTATFNINELSSQPLQALTPPTPPAKPVLPPTEGRTVTTTDNKANPAAQSSQETQPSQRRQNNVHHRGQRKKDFCSRCYNQGHRAPSCRADRPKNQATRCPCGSSKHLKEQCLYDFSKIQCERCQAFGHRAGMCCSIVHKQTPDVTPPTTEGKPTETNNFIHDGYTDVNIDYLLDSCYHIQMSSTVPSISPANPEVDAYCEAGSYPIRATLALSDDTSIKAILDSGAGLCYANTDKLEELAKADPNIELSWQSPTSTDQEPGCANGTKIKIEKVAILTVYSPQRKIGSKRLRVHCTRQLVPDFILGVSGLRALEMALIFNHTAVRAMTGTLLNQHMDRQEEPSATVLRQKLTQEIPATSGPGRTIHFLSSVSDTPIQEVCLFDTANYLSTLTSQTSSPLDYSSHYTFDVDLDIDYSYDLYGPLSQTSTAARTTTNSTTTLIDALLHPGCTFRGLTPAKHFLHDFPWTPSRPTPSSINKQMAIKHAAKLYKSLSRRHLHQAYLDVFDNYLKEGLILQLDPCTELNQCYFTVHFPVLASTPNSNSSEVTAESVRKTKIRPVFDWRPANNLQGPTPVIDRDLVAALTTTRTYKHVAWADLKAAFLHCDTTQVTSYCHAFVVAQPGRAHVDNDEDPNPLAFKFYRFLGLPMGSKSSSSGLQVSTSILLLLCCEATEYRLSNGTKPRSLMILLDDCNLPSEELVGLPEPSLRDLTPSPMAAKVHELVSADNFYKELITQSAPAKDSHMRQNGCTRVKYQDDFVLGGPTQEEVNNMYTEGCSIVSNYGHQFSDHKTKRSWDSTTAHGLGIIWTDDDHLTNKDVNVAHFKKMLTMSSSKTFTVRQVLSAAHSCHDPLGYLGWSILPLKKILRKYYLSKTPLDSPVSPEDSSDVLIHLEQFNTFTSSARLARYVDLDKFIVAYSDSSSFAFGAYLCGSNITIPFWCLSKLVPLNMMHFTIVRKETLALEATLDLLTSRLYYIPFSSHRQLYILCDSSIVVQRVCRLRRLRKTLESSSESPERMPSKQKLGAWEYAHCLKIADSLDQLAKQFGDDKVHFHHCPGKLNPADFYSRGEPPLTRTLEEAQVWLNSLFNNHAGTPEDHTINIVDSSPPTAAPTTTTTVPSSVTTDLFSYVIDAQQTDPFCRVARKLITGSNLPTPDDLHDLFIDYTDDQKAKIKATYRVTLESSKEALRLAVGRFAGEEGPLYVPTSARRHVLGQVHTYFCHRPNRYLVEYMEPRFYFHNLKREVRTWSKTCVGCQTSRGSPISIDHQTALLSHDFGANVLLSIDWLGPVQSTPTAPPNPYKYILHLFDPARKFNYFALSPDKSGVSARRLFADYIWTFGSPHYVVADCDKSFTGKELTSYTQSLGITVYHGFPHSAHRRAYSERIHQELFACIRSVQQSQRERRVTIATWQELVKPAAFVLNSCAALEGCDVAPHDLTFLYKAALPPSVSGDKPNEDVKLFVSKHVDPVLNFPTSTREDFERLLCTRREEFNAAMAAFHKQLKSSMRRSQMKLASKSKRRRRETPFLPGSPVWIRNPNPTKLAPRWTGPAICEGSSDQSVQCIKLRSLNGASLGIVHCYNLKPAVLTNEQLARFRELESSSGTATVPPLTRRVHPLVQQTPNGRASGTQTPIPVTSSRRFPHTRYFLAASQAEDGSVSQEVQRSITKTPTGLWICCDRCDCWTEVTSYIFNRFKDGFFDCSMIDSECLHQSS